MNAVRFTVRNNDSFSLTVSVKTRLTINTHNFPLDGLPGPSQLNPSRRKAEASCAVPSGSSGEIGREKKMERAEKERGEVVPAKTEVKRYIWLNGHRRVTVYKAFYIYRIPVVARFLYRGDKRLFSMTDLLSRGVLPDSTTGTSTPLPFVTVDPGGRLQGDVSGEILIG